MACTDCINRPGSFQKLPRLSQDGSSIWSCRGSAATWQRKTLHLRADLRSDLVPLDRFATARVGGSWAPECEVVRLHPSSADALGMNAQAAPFSCLRLQDQLPEGVVTVELKPGNGLLELYGQPGLYHMQDESLLRSAEMAKGGSYSAVDIFSGRRERVLRALEALNAQGKCGDAELQVLVDERPATMDEAAQLLQVTGGTASAAPATAAPVLAIIAQLLDGRSGQEAFSGLLPCLLRAQCAGGPALHSSCAQLNETLKSKDGGTWKVSVEDMENAMKRGYWSLPPDQSGLHLREREAERLLDRAKRELWQEGSASRLELEKQIRRFLCLNLLGDAACHARLRFSFARPQTPLEQESLVELHFLQVQSVPGIWCRLELAPLQLKSL
eukprot:s714_g20.t1